MIENLHSLTYKKQVDFAVNYIDNSSNLPEYSEQLVNNQIQYTKTFIPEYLTNTYSLQISSYNNEKMLIDEYEVLQSSYNPLDLQVNFLSGLNLDNMTVPFFKYWYNHGTKTTLNKYLSSSDNFITFSDNIGCIVQFTDTINSKAPNDQIGCSLCEQITNYIPNSIIETIKEGNNITSNVYSDNTLIFESNDCKTSHGSKLAADIYVGSRYSQISAEVIGSLQSTYGNVMKLTNVYTKPVQEINLSEEPVLTGIIENNNVLVDKNNNKISMDLNWSEQVLLSAFDII